MTKSEQLLLELAGCMDDLLCYNDECVRDIASDKLEEVEQYLAAAKMGGDLPPGV